MAIDDKELLKLAEAIDLINFCEDGACEDCVLSGRKTSNSKAECLIGEPWRWPVTTLRHRVNKY